MESTVDKALVPETLRGYRAWTIDRTAWRMVTLSPESLFDEAIDTVTNLLTGKRTYSTNAAKLFGAYSETPWKTTREARCSVMVPPMRTAVADGSGYIAVWDNDETPARPRHAGPPPDRDCTCGIYALYSPYGVRYARETRNMQIDGVIEASGTIHMNTRGMRAARAKIVALAPVSYELAMRLTVGYPDVRLFYRREEMYDCYPPEDLSALDITPDREQQMADGCRAIVDREAPWRPL